MRYSIQATIPYSPPTTLEIRVGLDTDKRLWKLLSPQNISKTPALLEGREPHAVTDTSAIIAVKAALIERYGWAVRQNSVHIEVAEATDRECYVMEYTYTGPKSTDRVIVACPLPNTPLLPNHVQLPNLLG